jgi:hypothetical protein
MELKNFWKKIIDLNNLIHAVPTIITGTMNEPNNRRQKQKKTKTFLINMNAKANKQIEKRNKNIC